MKNENSAAKSLPEKELDLKKSEEVLKAEPTQSEKKPRKRKATPKAAAAMTKTIAQEKQAVSSSQVKKEAVIKTVKKTQKRKAKPKAAGEVSQDVFEAAEAVPVSDAVVAFEAPLESAEALVPVVEEAPAEELHDSPVEEEAKSPEALAEVETPVPEEIIPAVKKSHKKTIWVSLLVVFSLLAGGVGIKFYFDYQAEQAAIRLAELRAEEEAKLAITLPKEFPSIEALSTFESEDLIQSYYGIKLTSDPKVLDTSTLGEKTIVYTITSEKYPDITKSFEVKVTVKDTTAPVLDGVKNLSLTVGGSLDLLEALSASDNFDGDLKDKIEILGDYDFNKAGTYDLQVVVSDSSGNSTTQDFTLTVNKKSVVVDSGTGSSSSGSSGVPAYVNTPANYGNPIVAAAMSYVGSGPMNCTFLTFLALQGGGVIPYADSSSPYWWMDGTYPQNIIYLPDPYYYYFENFCTEIYDDFRPGDLISWPGHIAVYIGDGKAVHGGWNGGNVVVAGINLSKGYPSSGWRCQ